VADCFDLEGRLEQLKKERAQAEELERQHAAEAAQLVNDKKPKRVTRIKMVSGDYLEIDPQSFWKQWEKDAMAMGSKDVGEYVRAAMGLNARPNGSKGLNINWSQLRPSEQNIANLLRVLELEFNKSDGAANLRRPFTEGAANAAFLETAQAYGADPRALADAMKRKLGGIDQLPSNAFVINRVKRDAVRHYADVLEQTAELMTAGLVDAQIADWVGNAAQWAHYWMQLDSQVGRKVAQALRTRQYGSWAEENAFVKFDKALSRLKYEDITGESLAQQVLDGINDGNPQKLKQLATVARLDALSNTPLLKPGFMTQVEMLLNYRRDNLFSSSNTWLVRNPLAVMVSAYEGVTDIVEGGLRYGVKAELEATGHAARAIYEGMNTAWLNAWDHFAYGKPTLAADSIEDLDPRVGDMTRQKVFQDFKDSWDLMTNFSYHVKATPLGSAVTFFNLLSSGFRILLGTAIEEGSYFAANATGKNIGGITAGYMPAFRALGGFDEATRKASFDWRVAHEARLRATQEAKTVPGANAAWIRQRAEEMAGKASFSGLMTEDQLAQLRLRELGVTPSDVTNEELRLQWFNNHNGTPNLADELGRMGADRMATVTFTQKLDDNITQGIGMMRKNPLVSWVIPVWRQPVNGVKWILNNNVLTQAAKELYTEAENLFGEGGRLRGGDGIDDELMAKSRARAITAGFLAGAVQLLWEAELFTDGGPTNEEDRKRWNQKPYAFNLSIGPLKAERLSSSGNSIDFVDLMGLQADMNRAWHEGRLDNNSFTTFMQGMVTAYGRVLMNKSALDGATTLINAVIRAGRGNEVDWFEPLKAQFSGVLPMSGLFTQINRVGADPNQVPAKRRQLTAAEYAAFGKDPNWDYWRNVASRLFNNYPVLTQMVPPETENRDWLGRVVRRPLGLPTDLATPFMPVIQSDTPLDKWLFTHGLGMKPRPEARLSASEVNPRGGRLNSAPVTMDIAQERTYRKAMYSLRGEAPAAQVLGARNAVIGVGTNMFPIDRYVHGKTLYEALTALSKDPDYNLELTAPDGPSLVAQPNTSLSDRKSGVNDPRGVYRVFDSVVTYFDTLAIQAMVGQHPELIEAARGNVQELQNRVRQRLEMSPIGIQQR